jgi:hypothetical protein
MSGPVLQPLKDRAERILKDLEDRKTTGLAAMDLLAALAAEGRRRESGDANRPVTESIRSVLGT